MTRPTDTAHPTTPVVVDSPGDSGQAGTGRPGRPKGFAKRKARKSAVISERDARRDPASRAQAIEEICAEVSGDRGAPVPLAVACRAWGVPYETVMAALQAGNLPQLEAARARGVMRVVRAATKDGQDGRQWAWLAERLAPRELHLPTKVTGVSAEDGGAPLTLAAAPSRTPNRAELLAIAAEATAAARALPEDATEDD